MVAFEEQLYIHSIASGIVNRLPLSPPRDNRKESSLTKAAERKSFPEPVPIAYAANVSKSLNCKVNRSIHF
jgi:hypothetical protein